MPANHEDAQFISLLVPNATIDMLAERVAALKEAGHNISRSELIRCALTRTSLDRAERDAVRRKNVKQIRKGKRPRRDS